jgi:hypothetical protein
MGGSTIVVKRLRTGGIGDMRGGLGKEMTAREEAGILDVGGVADLGDMADIEAMTDIHGLGILLTMIVGSLLVFQFRHHGVAVSFNLFVSCILYL